MKTLNEILDNYKDYAVVLDDRFGSRLAKFLTEEQLEKIGFKYDGDEPYPEPKEWTRENILEQLKSDVEFGFEKALDQRGISASLMFYVVLRWNQVLEEGLENYPEENYAMIRQDIAKYMYRDCIVDGGRKGVIIGFEDNNQFFDYYYIVYVPELNTTVYQLANDARFINSIEI